MAYLDYGYLTGTIPLPYRTAAQRTIYRREQIQIIQMNVFNFEEISSNFSCWDQKELELRCLNYRMREIDKCLLKRTISGG
jgi:hypothetical protein